MANIIHNILNRYELVCMLSSTYIHIILRILITQITFIGNVYMEVDDYSNIYK